MNSSLKGHTGEAAAVTFLESRGYRVVERNFRCRRGEIDIIAREKESLVFVEVKCWDVYSFSELEYALDGRKVKRLLAAARYYLHKHPGAGNCTVRFDVIFLTENMTKIEHVINAFSEV